MMGLPANKSEILARLADACAHVPGVAAVALGGSYARGRARPDSDLDIALLYRRDRPFRTSDIAGIAAGFNDAPSPTVSRLGDWGPWVDGGAWLTVNGVRVDFLYRSCELVEDTWADALDGRFDLHHGQQPPFGYFGPTVLGEVTIAQALHDPGGELAGLKSLVSHYPDRLRASVVQSSLWDAQFNLAAFAPKFAAAGNAYGAVGCFARAAHRMALTLFALNRTWLLNDKTALDEIAGFALAPHPFADRVKSCLGHAGATPAELQMSLDTLTALLRETAAIAGDFYRPAWAY